MDGPMVVARKIFRGLDWGALPLDI